MLSDTAVRQAKADKKPRKIADEKGLYLYVAPSGVKSFRFDYRYLGTRFTLTLGRYPDVSLKKARKRHAEAREALEEGQNPTTLKKRDKAAKKFAAANTFADVAEEWFAELAPHRSKSWNLAIRGWLDNYINPKIGNRPLEAVDPQDVLTLVRRIADDGTPTVAEYVRWLISRVYSYAIRNMRTKANPAKELRGVVTIPPPKHHKPLSPKELPEFIRKVDAYDGRPETRLAMKLLLLTFVRKQELVGATWDEIDWDAKEWRIPGERMKMKETHLVPLSRQAIAVLKELKTLAGNSKFVFQHFGDPRRHMSGFTLNQAFIKMKYAGKFKPHGIRATASTTLNEQGFRADLIEKQLAHAERSRVRAAYNQATYIDERRAMMQQWATYLDGLASGAKVVNIGAHKR